MDNESKWLLTDEEKDSFIATLTPNLTVLRTKAEISQEELANLIGVSRQTYSAIERKVRRMAWSTYLSLVFFVMKTFPQKGATTQPAQRAD